MTMPRPPRRFVADDVLAGRVNLDDYPFRYIYLSVPENADIRRDGRAGLYARIDVTMAAVEFLETRGWELVNFSDSGQLAYLRRVAR